MNFNKIRQWRWHQKKKTKGSIDKTGCDQETFAPPFSLSETINFTHKTLRANVFLSRFSFSHIKVFRGPNAQKGAEG